MFSWHQNLTLKKATMYTVSFRCGRTLPRSGVNTMISNGHVKLFTQTIQMQVTNSYKNHNLRNWEIIAFAKGENISSTEGACWQLLVPKLRSFGSNAWEPAGLLFPQKHLHGVKKRFCYLFYLRFMHVYAGDLLNMFSYWMNVETSSLSSPTSPVPKLISPLSGLLSASTSGRDGHRSLSTFWAS